MVSAMLGHKKRFVPLMALGPTLGIMFFSGVILATLFPGSLIAGWLMLIPLALLGGVLVFGIVASVIGHFLR
jgi:hypothetical protein